MQPDEILAQFAAAPDLPHEALRAAVTHATALAPKVTRLAKEMSDGAYLSPGDQNTLFFGLYALAAARETTLYRPLTTLLHTREDLLESVLGDSVTEDVPAMLVAMFDGDTQPLYALLEDRAAGSYVKWGVFEVLTRLVHDGRAPRQPFVDFLDRFERDELVDPFDAAWQGWQDAIGTLRIEELKQRVLDGWDKGRNDLAGEEDYEWWLDGYNAAPGSEGDIFDDEHTTPFDDPVKALRWASFGDDDAAAEPGALVDPTASTKLKRSEMGWLAGFLISDHVPETALNIEMFDGFVTALAIVDERRAPDDWLPMVWCEAQTEDPDFLDEEQEHLVVDLLTRHKETVRAQLATGLPRRPLLTRDADTDPASAWCGGFLRCVALGSGLDKWRTIMREEVGSILFGAMVSLGTGTYKLEEDGPDIALSSSDRQKVLDRLPELIADVYAIAHPHAPRPRRAPEPRYGTFKREGKKVGRNDPCPCGSGRKFKVCCIGKDGETVN